MAQVKDVVVDGSLGFVVGMVRYAVNSVNDAYARAVMDCHEAAEVPVPDVVQMHGGIVIPPM